MSSDDLSLSDVDSADAVDEDSGKFYTRSLKLDPQLCKFEKNDTAEISQYKKDLKSQHEIYLGLVAAFKDTEKDLKNLHKAKVWELSCLHYCTINLPMTKLIH